MEWQYSRTEQTFDVIPEGKYRIRINSAEKAQSKTGRNMLTLKFDVSGTKQILFHHIVFLPDRPEITNRNLTQFFDSFAGIPEGDFNMNNWIGKVGACVVKHEEYNGSQTARIAAFIPASKQNELPPWNGEAAPAVNPDGFMSIPDGAVNDFPFPD